MNLHWLVVGVQSSQTFLCGIHGFGEGKVSDRTELIERGRGYLFGWWCPLFACILATSRFIISGMVKDFQLTQSSSVPSHST